ncbi:hypothetical protein OO009_14570, partial [Flavobacteriaceae bacterium KMM 6897]|nr:hypothetical protein [Flavobacteriaceae bacterium KMM 6897]
MRLKEALLVFLMSTTTLTYGQIKIGDNPQNINQASVLELESTSRAFVITRVSTAQMNAITPLQGAMVYNTTTKCIHYHNGSQWLNLCDALVNSVNISLEDNGDGTYTFSDANNNLTQINNLNESLVVENGNLILTDTSGNAISVELQNLSAQTFTTDAIINTFPTIFITQDATGTNYNFEVGVIDGESIQDGSIRQIDLAGASVGSTQLRDNSVGNLAMADNAVGSLEIINGSVQPIDIGPGNSNQILTTNGAGAVQWVDQTGLVSAEEVTYNNNTSTLTSNNVQDALDEVTNNVNTLTIGDVLAQGNDAGNQNIRNVTDPSLSQDVATKNYVDQAITAGTADGSETILSNGTNINITGIGTSGSPYVINNTFTEVDGSVTNEIQTISLSGNNLILSNGGGSVPLPSGADGVISNISASANNLIFTGVNGGFNGNVNLEPLVDNAVANNGFLTVEVDGSITNEIITASSLNGPILTITEGGNDFDIDLTGVGGGSADGVVSNVVLNGNDLVFTGFGGGFNSFVDLSSIDTTLDEAAVDAFVANNGFLTTEVDGNITNEIITASSLTGTTLTITEGGNDFDIDLSGLGGGSTEEADGTTITGIGSNADPFKIEPSTVLGQFLRTDPATGNVIWDDLPTGTAGAVNSDGITIVGDGVASDLSVPTGGITSAQIFDGTIAAVDLNQMGAANDQILKWNGTVWAPAADAGGTVYAAGAGLTLNGTDFDVDNLAGEVTGPTTATVIANDAVTSAKIANGTIAAVDLNQMGAANDQILKWNGTV